MAILLRRDICAVCEKNDALITLKAVPFSEIGIDQTENFELIRCTRCDHIFQRFVPAKETSHSDERSAKSRERKLHARLSYFRKNAEKVQKAGLLIGGRPHERTMLDFGMGWGFFLSMAQAHGYYVLGVEIDEDRVSFARSRGIPSTPRLEALEKFSYIHADQVLEHVNDPLAILKKLATHLEKDGVLFVGVPNGKEIKPPYDPYKKVNQPLEHINCFSHASLVALARRAGLRPVSGLHLARSFFGYSLRSSISALVMYPFRTDMYFIKSV